MHDTQEETHSGEKIDWINWVLKSSKEMRCRLMILISPEDRTIPSACVSKEKPQMPKTAESWSRVGSVERVYGDLWNLTSLTFLPKAGFMKELPKVL